jgi:hypothetical protein
MKINKNVFILALATGLWLAGCSQAEDLPPVPEQETEEPEIEPECEDSYYYCNPNGTNLWPSLLSDSALCDKLIGKWQQIAWSSYHEEEMHCEASDHTIEFAVDGNGIQTTSSVQGFQYRIDSIYLYRTSAESVINHSVYYYAFQFSDDGSEFTMWYVTGLVAMRIGDPINFVYRRIEE